MEQATDRELLELAAKAAGADYEIDPATGEIDILSEIGGMSGVWNPLTDDGDAFRLMNKLHLNVQFGYPGECAVNAFRYDGKCDVEEMGTDQGATSRRAIVRAAAELGRQGASNG